MALSSGRDPACWLPLQHLDLSQPAFHKELHDFGVPFLRSTSSNPAPGQDLLVLDFAEDSVLAIRCKSISGKQCQQFTSPHFLRSWGSNEAAARVRTSSHSRIPTLFASSQAVALAKTSL